MSEMEVKMDEWKREKKKERERRGKGEAKGGRERRGDGWMRVIKRGMT